MDIFIPSAIIPKNHTKSGESFSSTPANSESGNDSALEDMSQYESFLMFEFLLIGIIGYLVIFVGLCGNCLSFVVLRQGWKESSVYIYMSGIAVADLLTLVTLALLKADALSSDMLTTIAIKTQFTYYILPYISPLSLTFQLISIYMTVALTVDRFIYICLPYKSIIMCTTSRAWKVVIVLYVICAIYQIPRWFEFKTKIIFNEDFNKTMALALPTEVASNYWYRMITFVWLYIPVAMLIPILALGIFNGFLIYTVVTSQRKAKSIGNAESADNSTTIMLISVVVFFLLCQTPALFQNLFYSSRKDVTASGSPDMSFLYYNSICMFLILLNSSSNIFLYCYFGPKFRANLLSQLRECCCKRRRHQFASNNSPPCCPISRKVSSMSLTSETVLTEISSN